MVRFECGPKKEAEPKRELCPLCNLSNSVGDCGHNHFFCNQCNVEFKVKKDRTEVYEMNEDGTVLLIKVILKSI